MIKLESDTQISQTGKPDINPCCLQTSLFSDDSRELVSYFKLKYRLIKRVLTNFVGKKKKCDYINILYLAEDCPSYMPKSSRLDSPIDYIFHMRQQYPNLDIRLMLPLIGLSRQTKMSKKLSVEFGGCFFDLERTSINFEFFGANQSWDCSVYKFNDNESNITIYCLFSPAFSYLSSVKELKCFEKAILFMRAARIAIKNLCKENFQPNIVHSEGIPFFLGSEFESKFPSYVKVLQIFDDFSSMETDKQEPFWSVINMADKTSIKKICKDSYIQNCISDLFSLPINNIVKKTQDYIDLVYDNYKIFHKYNADQTENKGDVVFNNLNMRIKKIFPNLFYNDFKYYYTFSKTLLNCDYWAVYSETYYKDLFSKKLASPSIMKLISKMSSNSGYVEPAISIKESQNRIIHKVYNNFDAENYRNERIVNKKILLREFASDFIKTNFIDNTLFNDNDTVKIYGYLDTFYDSPLLFANPDADVFSEGVDILFSTLLKLFERNKNIKIIVCIKDGLKNNYIKSTIDFLNENKIFMGHWVYVDGVLNLPKVLSGADLFLYPARICKNTGKHILGSCYGCVPVVSNAGLLNDTVVDIYDNIADGNGFKTKQSLLYEDENTNIYVDTLSKALELYGNNPASWNIVIKNNLTSNFGWNFSKLEAYNKIYQEIL